MTKKIHKGPAKQMNYIILKGLENFTEGNYLTNTAQLAKKIVLFRPATIKFPTCFSN